MSRTVVWTRPALKDLQRMDRAEAAAVRSAVTRFAATREGDVQKLTDKRPPEWRLRVGNYRARFTYSDGAVQVLRVLPRGEAYR